MTDTLLTRRIRRIRLELCEGNNALFASRLGKSRQHISALCSGKSHAGRSTLDGILKAFPTLSREWLYFGNGDMLTDAPTPPSAPVAETLADIADHLAQLSELFNALSSCVSKSES